MDIFGSLRSAIKIDEVRRDNNIFKLHYKATSLFLIGCSALVASRQHFGDPIDCIRHDDIPKDIMNTYCWIHSTFTLPAAYNMSVGDEVPHPGIDKYTPGESRVYHKYYQWVYFVLFFQAVCFYVPRYLWKSWEAKRLEQVVLRLNNPLLKTEDLDNDIYELANYFKLHEGKNQLYFGYFTFCEALNFFNVIFQMYLVNAFLGGTFTTYGLDVIRYSEMEQDQRNDPMIRVFPRMTKCTFHRYGSSGDVQRHDSLCILPLNIINEKIYIFMWFWFVLLGFLSGCMLIYRALTIYKGKVRYSLLRWQARFANREDLKLVIEDLKCGDWFLLYMVCKNVDAINFKHLVGRLAKIKKRGTKKDGRQNYPDSLSGLDSESKKLIPGQTAYEMPQQQDQ